MWRTSVRVPLADLARRHRRDGQGVGGGRGTTDLCFVPSCESTCGRVDTAVLPDSHAQRSEARTQQVDTRADQGGHPTSPTVPRAGSLWTEVPGDVGPGRAGWGRAVAGADGGDGGPGGGGGGGRPGRGGPRRRGGPARRGRRRSGRRGRGGQWPARTAETVVLAAGGALLVLAALTLDAGGRLLVGAAGALLVGLALRDLALRPRLSADPGGVVVRTLTGRTRLPWPGLRGAVPAPPRAGPPPPARRPRRAAAPGGVVVRTLTGRTRLPWPGLRVRLRTTRRLGVLSRLLEL